MAPTQPGSSRAFTLGIVLAILAGLGVTLFLTYFFVWHCSSGDGGAPFVADDSAQADVCNATGEGIVLLPIAVGLVVAGAVFARRLFRGRKSDRRRATAGILMLLLTPALPLLALLVLNAPSDICSAEREAAVEQWRAEGEIEAPPYSCEHY